MHYRKLVSLIICIIAPCIVNSEVSRAEVSSAAKTEIKLAGYIEVIGNTKLIKDESTEKSYKILSSNLVTARSLRKLIHGDYIEALGSVDDKYETAQLQSLEFVGLKKLIGLWRNEFWSLYEFTSFTQLNHYSANALNSSLLNQHEKTPTRYHYKIDPASEAGWRILFVGSKSIDHAILQKWDDYLLIVFIDPATGATSGSLSLYPLTF